MRRLILLFSHAGALVVGFALGIYLLPILIAPDAPDAELLRQRAENAQFTAEFTRDLRGSDFLHWGEGKIHVSDKQIVHEGKLAPGPDYKLYLVESFVEHEDEFNPVKDGSQLVGDIKTFEGFILNVPESIDTSKYNTVLIWCETFGEFITAAKYR